MSTLAQAKEALGYYIDANIPAFLWGPPGVGKSDTVREEVKDRKWGLVDFRAVLRDPVDLRGVPDIDAKAKRTVWYAPDDLPNEKRDGKRGILFLDELNAANQQVQAACFGLVLDRKLGDYRLPDGWVVVAAGNRQSDRSAAQRMPRALANRFAHIEVEPDWRTWIENYALEHCDPMITAFIRFRPGLIHDMELKDSNGKEQDERMFPTPRSWAQASKICNAPDNIRFTLVKGCVGEAAAAEFEGFVKTFRSVPDIDDIIRKPKTTDVPEEPSALFAVSGALARYANRDNFENILIYAQRLGREYEIIVGLDATKRDSMLTKTKAYVEFQKRNKDLQIGNFRRAA